MLMEDGENEYYFDPEEYPYYHTIKKLLYAFGDTLKNNHRTIIFFHDFLRRWLTSIAKVITECEFKKVLDHLYSYEYVKFHNYKKLKIKNNFNNEEELIVDNDGDGDVLIELDEKKDFIENLFEEKDHDYYENLIYQDERTKNMLEHEYIEYNICRTQSFLSKGKKIFINYLTNILTSNLPSELKDQNNLELITFLIKEIMHKIVKQAIRSKNPENKLFILKYPLLVSDVEELANQEIDTIESFLNDFYNSIYLIKEFKKKKLSKDNNKNVKIKKEGDKFTVVIKKFIFLEDCDNFKKIKTIAESRLTELVKKLNTNKKKGGQMTSDIDEISNYYEYFLMKDHFTIISLNKVQYTFTNLRKINKKFFISKLNKWLNMSTYERNIIISEYNNI
jgi:hypothetical protein